MDKTAIQSARCVPPTPLASAAINLVAERFQGVVEELRREARRIESYDPVTALRLGDAATAFCETGTSILQEWLIDTGTIPSH
ncbi:hypothetical protein [Glutamicibacter arilaitensis]|uniref:Uncharacterized protein n=1 Tax=Glutamicibacter arilaitensis TaxID=256701 RepID=A0A4Y8TZU1_9MICC|nr:hypothetical protein [Glutamicibacter arilaitensis]TFH57039.1 hypothetical protein EXY26_08590 [Glutamicibacter arilaitensis]